MYRISVDSDVCCAVTDVDPGGRNTIVFVHGWPFNQQIFDCQYAVLPEYGIRCIGVDLRGYGDSDKPWEGYDYDCMAGDLQRVLSGINSPCVTLCGFSMGAAICVRYMANYGGGKVKNLALCGGACPSFVQQPGYSYGMTRDQVDGLISQAYNNRPLFCEEFVRSCFYSNPGESYIQWMADLCMEAPAYAVIHSAQSLRDEDLRQDLGQIQVPTAIYHGVHDQVCPYSFAEEMHRGIPNSFVVPFEQSGHCLFYEQRDYFNSCLIDLVNL